ncbi:hypothetical protein [Altererythrobacter sp.]|uniref:hypothetical protein n=1 Tax=Altererythrobacter sp. TaxID=1872480 RepID=UPI003D083FE5
MQHNSDSHESTMEAVVRAIQTRRVIEAEYNGTRMMLSPHQLFVRHGSVFIKAYNPSKSRRHDEEPTLGVFNIVGMKNVMLTEQSFEPLVDFDGQLPRGDETSLEMVRS